MAASLSLTRTLAPNCAKIGVIQKMQWPAESTKCFLKPNTHPVCRRTALAMTGEKVAMKQIKKFHIRGCHGEPENVVIPETIRTDIKCLKKKVAEQDTNVHKLQQFMDEIKSRVNKMEKKFAGESPTDGHAVAHRENESTRTEEEELV